MRTSFCMRPCEQAAMFASFKGSQTTTAGTVSPALESLFRGSGTAMEKYRGAYPLEQFGGGYTFKPVTGESIAGDPALKASMANWETNVKPTIENTAAVSGLGRSTALTNAEARSKTEAAVPYTQAAVERETMLNAARYKDFLRQQGLSEQAVYSPFGTLAAGGLGSTSKTQGK